VAGRYDTQTMNRSSPLVVTRLRYARKWAAPLDVDVYLGRVMDGVRDHVVDWVVRNFRDAAWAGPFLAHLAKIGRYRLDMYTVMEFLLEEYSVRLVFTVLRSEHHEMTYRLPSLLVEPDPVLARPRGVFGWLLE
jgi:hypothetical protein